MTTEQRIAELERRLGRIEKYVTGDGVEYNRHHLRIDLTTPPPPEPPKIEVVAEGKYYAVKCGKWYWGYHENSDGGWQARKVVWSKFASNAITEKLTREKNYPPGVQG